MNHNDYDDPEGEAPTRLRRVPYSTGRTGDEEVFGEDVPTVARRITPPLDTPAKLCVGDSQRVRIHPKFDPRRIPTLRKLPPAQPPPRPARSLHLLEDRSEEWTVPLRRPTELAAAPLLSNRGIELTWVLAFLGAVFFILLGAILAAALA